MMSAGVNGSDDELLGFGFAGSNAPMEARSLFQRRLVNEGDAKFVILGANSLDPSASRDARPVGMLKRVQEAARKRILVTRAVRTLSSKKFAITSQTRDLIVTVYHWSIISPHFFPNRWYQLRMSCAYLRLAKQRSGAARVGAKRHSGVGSLMSAGWSLPEMKALPRL